ncbi:hypothetical protein Pcac1_g25108 [Phytophthora cactorum]|uniref:DUF4485 domain-containing protein n=4 Tax=Phytophthora TaxID=4783 RepID=A0A329S423_9STRA|nr:hypothetical protein Pcac1_g25108 [Phytophthora cactorum]KAG2851684.1 hypothetical protein PC113_g15691 [Phytophthora cactorum]KAG2912615.1 hypothetical protein PC114_g8838 [Phytophthora cactorum]KAG3059150.1 hypothetical protein PC121_g14078 [Phytophthora cactorum]KAG3147446.1 hypothetical protein C6341_g17738 [Phytophthora cactorum]
MRMTAAPNRSVKYLHNMLAHIQNLCVKASEEGNSNKHQRIRVTHWVRKLRSQPTSNPTWLKNVLEYANVLLQMILEGVIEEPFTKMPPQGPLAALPRHQVARLQAKTAKQIVRTQSAQHSSLETPPAKQQPPNNNSDENAGAVAAVDKQIQTQEQDDQWEWQRVWKGAFDKMHQQLQLKTEETEALGSENKEMRALVVGCKKALEEAERNQRDIEAKHLAEIENLRAVHALELSDLQDRHRQKLKEVTLLNDEKLLSRRRESNCIRPALSSNTMPRDDRADANADFLHYIDTFYSDTLNLMAQNKN